MKKIVVILFFLVFGLHCIGQDTLLNDFRYNWSADSLGVSGFRQKAIIRDCNKRTYLIKGLNIINLKERQIRSMLGTPNFEGQITNSAPFISCLFWTVNLPKRTRTINYLINKTVTEKGDIITTYAHIEIRNRRVYEVLLVNY